jgi:hypothetical protein
MEAFGILLSSVVSLVFQLLYPEGKRYQYPLHRKMSQAHISPTCPGKGSSLQLAEMGMV